MSQGSPLGHNFLPGARWEDAFSGPLAIARVTLPTDPAFLRFCLAQSPNILIVGRPDPGRWGQGGPDQDPDRRADLTTSLADQSGGPELVHVLEPWNEQGSLGNIAEASAHDARFARRVKARGYLASTGAWSVGNFPAGSGDKPHFPKYREALEACDFLNVHQGGVPGEDHQWTTYRHELSWPDLPAKPRLGVIVGELTPVDTGTLGTGHRGWRAASMANPHRPMTEDEVIAWYWGVSSRYLRWAHETGTRIWAATYCYGPGVAAQWATFDHQGRVGEAIGKMQRERSPTPWRSGPRPKPVEPRPEPPVTVVIDAARQLHETVGVTASVEEAQAVIDWLGRYPENEADLWRALNAVRAGEAPPEPDEPEEPTMPEPPSPRMEQLTKLQHEAANLAVWSMEYAVRHLGLLRTGRLPEAWQDGPPSEDQLLRAIAALKPYQAAGPKV